MHKLSQRFGENLREIRKNNKLSQFQLGIEIDSTEDTIANYESGRRWPDVESIEAMATVLKVDPEEFFKRTSSREI